MNGTSERREENFINSQKSFSKTVLHGVIEFPSNRPFDHIFFAISIVMNTFDTRLDTFCWTSTSTSSCLFIECLNFVSSPELHPPMKCFLYSHNWHMHKRTFKWTLNVLHAGDEANGIAEHLIPLPIPCDGICQKLKSFKLTACASSVAAQFFQSSQKISHLTSETFSYPIYLWSWYGMTFDKSSHSAFSGSHPFLSSSPKTESSLPTASKKNYH